MFAPKQKKISSFPSLLHGSLVILNRWWNDTSDGSLETRSSIGYNPSCFGMVKDPRKKRHTGRRCQESSEGRVFLSKSVNKMGNWEVRNSRLRTTTGKHQVFIPLVMNVYMCRDDDLCPIVWLLFVVVMFVNLLVFIFLVMAGLLLGIFTA
mmetsp:Transcript_21380/g.49344  ORF Transcript_21380/g.49344 Transcript_21380/m.49344 type:complete len:151 (-) Transcript_21380:129-581(-)